MIFKIHKDSHSSTPWIWPFTWRRRFQTSVRFGRECLVRGASHNDEDLNKLFGLSDGLHHSIDSVRVAWRAEGEYISLWGYYHKDRKIDYQFICVVPVEQFFTVNLVITSNDYVIQVITHKFYELKRERSRSYIPVRYKLKPYFGGDLPASVDMKIEINGF